MFGFRKKVTLLRKVRNNMPETIFALFVAVICFMLCVKVNILTGTVVSFIIGFVGVRLFFGKLKLKAGDVVLFWGLPGSGKTMFANKVALYNREKFGYCIVGNEEFYETSFLCDALLPRKAFGFFRAPEGSLIAIDEASLNGWDNRDWQKNFTPESLSYWKKIRHYKNCAVLTNQGFAELDCKIRDSLCNCIYYVTNHGWYSKAVRMDKSVTFSDVTGLPQEGYCMPSIWQRLLDPSCVLYVRHKTGGKNFSTYNPDNLPPLSDIDKWECVEVKKGSFQWRRKQQLKNLHTPNGRK